MKHLSTSFIFMLIALTACQKSNVVPVVEKKPITARFLQSISPNSAKPFNSSFDIILGDPAMFQFNSCSGDALLITGGVLHIDTHGTINGSKISVAQHINADNYKMIDTSNGAVYVGSSTSDLVENEALAGNTFTITETQSVLLTTSGSKNNSTIKFDLHETFDANGNLTAFIDNFRSGCK